jgi:sugar phosphate permease
VAQSSILHRSRWCWPWVRQFQKSVCPWLAWLECLEAEARAAAPRVSSRDALTRPRPTKEAGALTPRAWRWSVNTQQMSSARSCRRSAKSRGRREEATMHSAAADNREEQSALLDEPDDDGPPNEPGPTGAATLETQSLRALMSTQKVMLLATMYVSYCMAIFSSSSFEVSIPAALDDSSLGLAQKDFALALSVGQVATVVGKLFCGFVVDLRGASSAFYEALLVIGIVMFAGIGCVSVGLNSMALLSFVVLKLAKSAIWPAMAKAAKAAFDASIFGRVWGVLVTSSRFGAVCGGLVLSPLVPLGWAWPGLLVACGSVLMAMALRFQTIRERSRSSTNPASTTSAGDTAGTISMRDAALMYGRDPKLLLIVASEGMLLAVMDTSSLLPLYLHTQLGADLDEAARLAALFPLGMAMATFAGGFMYDALGPAMRANMLLVLGLSSALCYVLLASATTPLRAGILLFGAGACFAPAKYLPPTIYTLENVDSQQ